MFNDISFKTLENSLDAVWTKQKAHSNNIANYETPEYKATKVSFDNVLEKSLETGAEKSVFTIDVDKDESTSLRLDGNNVNMEKESLELWETYSQYSYLTQKISGSFKNMRYVIGQAGR